MSMSDVEQEILTNTISREIEIAFQAIGLAKQLSCVGCPADNRYVGKARHQVLDGQQDKRMIVRDDGSNGCAYVDACVHGVWLPQFSFPSAL